MGASHLKTQIIIVVKVCMDGVDIILFYSFICMHGVDILFYPFIKAKI